MSEEKIPPGFDIEALVADMKPVRRLRPLDGALIGIGMTALAAAAVAMTLGWRPDLVALHPEPIVILRVGTLLLLGLATLTALAASARPAIGERNNGWRWALAAALLFPVASMILVAAGDPMPMKEIMQPAAITCMSVSTLSALAIGTALTLWLRRGAVVQPRRAGMLTGLSAGAFGTLAYSLHCPVTSVHYIAVWYSIAILTCTLIGRLVVPRLIRW